MSGSPRSGTTARRMALSAAIAAVLVVLATLGALYGTGALATQSRQEVVAERGAGVMPFDLEKTTHVLKPLNDGRLQTVNAKDTRPMPSRLRS